ncbi:MAG: EAL domain-containing protein, partial [Hyphomicrobiales bacterium]|nr:EAL domain-containing protein [Hyphomicrobiales bacterium]
EKKSGRRGAIGGCNAVGARGQVPAAVLPTAKSLAVFSLKPQSDRLLDQVELTISTSTSIGIAIVPADGWKIDSLLKKADMALYAAKAEGTGSYRFFEAEMEVGAHRRRAIEDGLRSALKNGEMQVAFQPLVDLRSWSLAGCEALARWKSPEWGFVSPAEFIPVAEACGMIDEIGEWVLREAVKEALRWPDDTVVAVNQ